ncbi:YcaO-like family protein [Litoreibacter arenae]|nr:YcaO-like family protein [Litoreibacter arenae]
MVTPMEEATVLGKALQPDTTASASKRWQHRTVEPEETIQRLERIRDITGITRVADLTELDRIGIPVAQAVRPMGKLLTVSQGKGLTLAAAKASAMMEATEIWHAENLMLEGPRATSAEIESEAYLDPQFLRNIEHKADPDDAPLDWAPAKDLVSGASVMVPRDSANLDFTRPADPPWLLRNTNGLAGGNTMGEARSSALAEVIERACRAEFERLDEQARSACRLDPDLVAKDSSVLGDLIEMIHDADLVLDLHNLTNALAVTTIRAVIYETDKTRPSHRPSRGHGAHLDPVTAISRAITEAAQTRITYISGNRDDLDPIHYAAWNLSNTIRALERQMDFATTRASLDLTDQSTAFPRCDVSVMIERIEAQNAGPVICLDLSHPELGIPVQRYLLPVSPHGGRQIHG